MFLPNVIEESGRGLRNYDLPSKLFESGIIFLNGEINDESANATIMQLLYLDALNDDNEPTIYINSGGGDVYAGSNITDVIQTMKKKVNVVCMAKAMSMGSYILSSATGRRSALPNSRILLHSVSSGSQGSYHDLKVQHNETEYLQEKLLRNLSEFSKGKTSYEQMVELTQRDKYLTPEEYLELGLIDEIIEKTKW